MQEDVLVMDVGCACDVLWMYVMDYVCVLCDAKCLCAVSYIIYEFYVFAFEGKQQTNKKLQISQLCRVPTLGKEVFAECQGCGTRQSWKKLLQNSHFPSFAECHSLALGKEVNFAECQMVPLGKDYF